MSVVEEVQLSRDCVDIVKIRTLERLGDILQMNQVSMVLNYNE